MYKIVNKCLISIKSGIIPFKILIKMGNNVLAELVLLNTHLIVQNGFTKIIFMNSEIAVKLNNNR